MKHLIDKHRFCFLALKIVAEVAFSVSQEITNNLLADRVLGQDFLAWNCNKF